MKPKGARRAVSPAFTLVELLVVISVLAILISILLPSFRRARDQSKRVACGANLHEIGHGLNMYLIDSNDFLPVVEYLPSIPDDPDHALPSIAQVLLPYIQKDAEDVAKVDNDPNANANDNSSYANKKRPDNVFHCPADLPGRTESGEPRPGKSAGKSYFQTEGSSYDFNTRLYRLANAEGGSYSNGRFEHPVKLSEVVRTRHAQHIFGGQPAVEEIWLMHDYKAFHGKPGKPGACNYLYVDGRVGDLQR
jgi:prepilin-type N-terminal cleavage/methylation domain-containing protein/prepilin-type processing-associated H-X9-DG protein